MANKIVYHQWATEPREGALHVATLCGRMLRTAIVVANLLDREPHERCKGCMKHDADSPSPGARVNKALALMESTPGDMVPKDALREALGYAA